MANASEVPPPIANGVEESTTTTTMAAPVEDATESLEDRFQTLSANTDAFFLLVIGIIIFFMQAGFAFLEAGSVRQGLALGGRNGCKMFNTEDTCKKGF